MTVQFRTQEEIKGINDFGQQPSDQNYSATLTAATDTKVDVPGGGIMGGMTSYNGSNTKNKMRAVISTDLDVWMAVDGTAAVPAGASFSSTTSILIPAGSTKAFDVNVAEELHFISKAATTPSISVSFYALNS